MSRSVRFAWFALLLLVTARAGYAEPFDFSKIDPADYAEDTWYVETVNGRAVGYWHIWLMVDDEGRIGAGNEHYRVEKHGNERAVRHERNVWTDDANFAPVVIMALKQNDDQKIVQGLRFLDDGMTFFQKQRDQVKQARMKPFEEDFLTYAQHLILFQHHAKAGQEAFTFTTISANTGFKPYQVKYWLTDEMEIAKAAEENAPVTDQIVRTYRSTFSTTPGFEILSLVDEQGRVLGYRYDVGEKRFAITRSTKEQALKQKFDPPQFQQSSTVKPGRAIDQPARVKRAVYELAYHAGQNGVTPVESAHQQVERIDDRRVRVTVDLTAKADETLQNQDQPTEAHLASSIMIDAQDQAVQKLASRAVRGLDDDAISLERAKACKRTVSGHLTEVSLAIGDGTASEAARTGKGDCTESAVLLAAMLRAHGIPSRCVTGLVYSPEFGDQKDVFVYHMWTQAWIEDKPGEGRWVDLDAARWRYSGVHIALGVSAMGADYQADKLKLLPMMRGLTIDVLETSR